MTADQCAGRFVGPEFTIAELRGVYAAEWGEDLHAGTGLPNGHGTSAVGDSTQRVIVT